MHHDMSRFIMNPLSECLRLTKSDLPQIKETPENTSVYRGFGWLRGLDLNQRPSGYEPDELPDCSTPRKPDARCQKTDVKNPVFHLSSDIWHLSSNPSLFEDLAATYSPTP